MTQNLYGRKIFGLPTVGSLTTTQNPNAGTILVARKLSPSVVRTLSARHVAVLTCRGGFACHGANVLRAAIRAGLNKITWVTNLPDELLQIPTGTECEILANGIVIIASPEQVEAHSTHAVGELVGVLSSGDIMRCYWPDRVYDRFTASMMLTGLSLDLQALGYESEAVYGPDGLIWFVGRSPTSNELLNQAQFSSHICQESMNRQQALYSKILEELVVFDQEDGDLHSLADICRSYFSCFILHHRTYTDVLLRGIEIIGDSAKTKGRNSLLESILCTDLVQWYSNFPDPLSLRKDFLSEPRIVPLPPFRLGEEIDRAEERIAISAEEMGIASPVLNTIRNMVRLCILKEWKFILNKLITSRVAERLRRLPLSSDTIRALTIRQVLATCHAS